MERTLSHEEKIRRAEEIYARRRVGYERVKVATVNVSEEKKYGLLKKMILQIIICLAIYLIFYLIQNSNHVFSTDVINKTKEILSYDIDLTKVYSIVVDYVNDGVQSFTSSEESTDEENQIQEQDNELNEENTRR